MHGEIHAGQSSRHAKVGGMATIHTGTTMAPTKLELLAGWLPRQPWYAGPGRRRADAGRRLPARRPGRGGRHRVRASSPTGDGGETTYAVPMSYRAAPLPGRGGGPDRHLRARRPRHAVDLRRRARPGRRRRSCSSSSAATGRRAVAEPERHPRPDGRPALGRPTDDSTAPTPLRVRDSEPGRTTVAVELTDAAAERPCPGRCTRSVVLEPGTGTGRTSGRVEADWTRLDGGTARGPGRLIR